MVTCKLYAQTANQAFMLSAAICHALRMNTSYAFPRKTTAPQIWRTYFNHLPQLPINQATRHYYKESSPVFSPIPDHDDITLEGYFQSEKYWYDYKEQLAEIMSFKHEPAEYVAIHVRRGDYLKYPDQFPVLPIKYYLDGMSFLIGKGFSKFRFYSDDIKWCKVNFGTLGNHYEYSENKDPITDMKDMFNASAFIIANWSFVRKTFEPYRI